MSVILFKERLHYGASGRQLPQREQFATWKAVQQHPQCKVVNLRTTFLAYGNKEDLIRMYPDAKVSLDH